MAYDYIVDENGPPEDLDAFRMLECKTCGTVVRVKRPASEPMYTNNRGQSWPTFGEPEAPNDPPEQCKQKHCPGREALREKARQEAAQETPPPPDAA